MIKLENILNEDLRAWFGKGGKGGVGGGGWDRYNSSGDRVGKCGDAKEGDAYAACLSKEVPFVIMANSFKESDSAYSKLSSDLVSKSFFVNIPKESKYKA